MGLLGVQVAALAEGVVKTMLLTKLKAITVAVVLVLGTAALGGGLLWQRMAAAQPGKGAGRTPDPNEAPVAQGGNKGGGGDGQPGRRNLDAIVWGDAVAGLQAGIGYRPGEGSTAQTGQSVSYVVYLRNVGKQAVTVSYLENVFEEFVPTVVDQNGKQLSVVTGPRNLGEVSVVRRTLEPNETIRLSPAWLLVVAPGTKGVAAGPTLVAAPGRYRVRHAGIPLRVGQEKAFELRWGTGQLDLTIAASPTGKELAEPPEKRPPQPDTADHPQKGLTLQQGVEQAAREKFSQPITVGFQAEKATMAWTTGFKNKHPWVIQFTPKTGLKDGSEFQLCVTGKAATQLRKLGLVNDEVLHPGGYFNGKVVRMTGNIESWQDRDNPKKTIYRLCVFDLEQLEVVR